MTIPIHEGGAFVQASTGAENTDPNRPPAEERWTKDRTEPVRFDVDTRWLYSPYDARAIVPEGTTRHAFARGGLVMRSDVPSRYEHMNALSDHLYRAIEEFGDDAELTVEVRRRQPLEQRIVGVCLVCDADVFDDDPQPRAGVIYCPTQAAAYRTDTEEAPRAWRAIIDGPPRRYHGYATSRNLSSSEGSD